MDKIKFKITLDKKDACQCNCHSFVVEEIALQDGYQEEHDLVDVSQFIQCIVTCNQCGKVAPEQVLKRFEV